VPKLYVLKGCTVEVMPRYRQLRDVPRVARDVTPTQRILRAHGCTVSPLMRWLLRRK